MSGQFSIAPLDRLLKAGAKVGAVVVPGDRACPEPLPRRLEPTTAGPSDLPIIGPDLDHNIVQLAWHRGIPVWEVGLLSEASTLELIAALQPELIVVACFPHIFPAALLQLPRYGCLNLHPSLLPAYRGPAPLFWLARQNERHTGVTLHRLDEGLDTGDIVAQTGFDRLEGMSEAGLEQRCARLGADLLLGAVEQLKHGSLRHVPQPEVGASYFPWPSASDLVIPTHWPAQRAFNFLRGAENWPLIIQIGDTQFRIRVAISYAFDQQLEQPYLLLGDELWVQFRPGVLRAKIWAETA
jgi:methionyl-tRNA formyltransferase